MIRFGGVGNNDLLETIKDRHAFTEVDRSDVTFGVIDSARWGNSSSPTNPWKDQFDYLVQSDLQMLMRDQELQARPSLPLSTFHLEIENKGDQMAPNREAALQSGTNLTKALTPSHKSSQRSAAARPQPPPLLEPTVQLQNSHPNMTSATLLSAPSPKEEKVPTPKVKATANSRIKFEFQAETANQSVPQAPPVANPLANQNDSSLV